MEWKTVKLGEIVILHDSKRVPLSSLERAKRKGNYPYYGAASIVDYIDSYIFDGDYILLGEDGTVINDNGTPILQRPSGQFWVSNHAHVITNREGVDFDFLYYLLCNTNITSTVTGAVQMKVSQKNLLNIELPLPPLETQRRIAAILSSLDDKIENNNRINRNLEAQAQALFKSWFVDFEPWGGIMPEDWKEGTLGEICKIKYGKGLSTNLLTDEGYPVFGGNGVIGYYSKFLYELPQILVSCRGAASGKIMESDPHSFVTSNSLVLEMNDRAYYYYLKYLLLANPLYNYATGSAQPQITIDNIKDVDIVLPSIDIVNTISEKFEVIDEQIRSLRRENDRLAALRDTLLPKLMRGEITL